MAAEKAKYVVGLSGSPRKGANTDRVVKEILKGAREAGARTKFIRTADLKISGCVACYACKKKGKCAINDDMQALYKTLARADAWVLGTPVYWFTMSAQLKAPIDRLFAFANNPAGPPSKGKRAAVVTVCADDEIQEMGEPIFDAFAKGFKFLKVRFAGRLALQGVGKKQAKGHWKEMKRLAALGARLAR